LERLLHFECFRLNELLTQNNASFPEKLFDLSPLRRTQHTPCGGEELDAIVELLVGRLTRKRKLAQAMIDPRGPFKDGDTGGEVIEINRNADRLRTIERNVVVIPDPSLRSLAASAKVELFGVGEKVVQAGNPDEAFFLLFGGQVSLEDGTVSKPITSLSDGEFLAESVPFSGEPNPVTATILHIEGTAMNQLMQRQPGFALKISQFIDERRKLIRNA
jgi:hypothetical protein